MHVLWITAALLAVAAAEPGTTDFLPVAERPKLQSPAVNEASGLAISSANPDFMWIVNDSGGTSDIHLAGTDGTDRGKVTLADTRNIDWEDLASFSLDGNNYLLVADTGDNGSKRESCTLHILREPAFPADGKKISGTAPPEWRIQFQYEGGPRDCESVAVDTKAGNIVLVSKRTQPPEVYQLPLRPTGKSGLLTARRIGPTEVKSPLDSLIPFHNQPTGLDITADNSLAAVITYYGVFLFPRKPDENWADAFAKPPTALQPHLLAQAEAVAFSKDGKTIYALSEGRASPVARFQSETGGP
ncbi:MAG: hypothetical protein V4819_03290 [Verrucomicrobiota bacterium]